MVKQAKISNGDFHVISLNGRNEKECVKKNPHKDLLSAQLDVAVQCSRRCRVAQDWIVNGQDWLKLYSPLDGQYL
jgi:hypothetical protein